MLQFKQQIVKSLIFGSLMAGCAKDSDLRQKAEGSAKKSDLASSEGVSLAQECGVVRPGNEIRGGFTSCNGMYSFRIDDNDASIWAPWGKLSFLASTSGGWGGIYVLKLENDGVLRLRYHHPSSTSAYVRFSSYNEKNPAEAFVLQDDGNAVLYRGSQAVWDSKTFQQCGWLPVGTELKLDMTLSSCDGKTKLFFLPGGVMALARNGVVAWQSDKPVGGGGYFKISSDGVRLMRENGTTAFVAYNNRPNVQIKNCNLEPDGGFRCYTAGGQAVWGIK